MKIVCDNISKEFLSKQGKLKVLSEISAQTQEQDFVCILGTNGCGKTTLLKIMAGILKPSSGEIKYVGEKCYYQPTSLIFQENGLFPWLNVMDNACFGLEMQGFPRDQRYRKAEGYIEELGLGRFKNFYPHQLSTGMKHKVSLIRGLLMDPAALLIDEAVVSLDIYNKLVIQKDILKVWNEHKKTIVYVTHDIEEALKLARHVWIMSAAPSRIIKIFDISFREEEGLDKDKKDKLLLSVRSQIISILRQEAEKALL